MDWKDYENEIFDKFSYEFRDHEVTKEANVTGRFSRVNRHADILIRSRHEGSNLLGIVECKYFSKKIDVETVDSFIGLLEDIGANLGILITNEGCTKGAKNRAQISGIRLDIIDFKDLDEYHYDFEFCKLCKSSSSKTSGIIWYNDVFSHQDGAGNQFLFDIGHCDKCESLHLHCHKCGNTTAFIDNDSGSPVECSGGCGFKYFVSFNKRTGKSKKSEEIFILSRDM
ncbi:MAG: restriction endonuclease [Bacillota bacterium]